VTLLWMVTWCLWMNGPNLWITGACARRGWLAWHALQMPEIMTADLRGADPLDITCPRCGIAASVRFYGPCDACRDALRATVGTEAREVEVEAYEPKMNVVPNAIASKE